MAAEQAENAHQQALNANLLRISRERANTDRKPRPQNQTFIPIVSGSLTPVIAGYKKTAPKQRLRSGELAASTKNTGELETNSLYTLNKENASP